MNSEEAKEFLKFESFKSSQIDGQDAWRGFKKESREKQWVYLVIFSKIIFAWGTCSKSSDRLRKSSIFNRKLTGKYDRRVDYLMLKIIHVNPEVWVFEPRAGEEARVLEGKLKARFDGQAHCFGGFDGKDRKEISKGIFKRFETTEHWQNLNQAVQNDFKLLCRKDVLTGRQLS